MAGPIRLLPSLVLVAALEALAPPVSARPVSCPPGFATELRTAVSTRQLITVVAPDAASTSAALTLWQRAGGCWIRRAGPWPAALGYAGLSLHHREGEATTPEGAYTIGPVMYGNAPDPGLHYPYRRLVCGDWWDEDPTSAAYNTFVQLGCGQRPAFGGDSEALWLAPLAYAYFALIDYNTAPVVPGGGSAIFLHVSTGTPTDGCVAIARVDLVATLRWLRPDLAPLIVIGTAADIARLEAAGSG